MTAGKAEQAAGMSAPQWRSPFRALLWKEWRESWWALLLLAAFPAGWCVAANAWGWHADRILVPLLCFAFAAGARLFASDTARGTAHFQQERPVAMGAVWNAKVLLPLCALVGGIAIYGVIAPRFVCVEMLNPKEIPEVARPAFMLGAALLAFSGSALCSVVLDRPITALAGGFVLCFGLALGHAPLFNAFAEQWPVIPWANVVAGFGCGEACLLLLAGRVLYIRLRRL